MILSTIGKKLILALFFLLPCADTMADETGTTQKMPVMKITIDGEITKDMEYTNGTMQLTDEDGNMVEMKAQFRTRGATARSYLMKPALNMKLRTDDYSASQDSALLGMRSISKWILDAMAIDRICMRNRVAMDIWNEYAKLPYETDFEQRNGTQGRFIEMYINGNYMGIYCLSDPINRKLLDLKKYDEKKAQVRGVLYKSGTTDVEDQNSRYFTEDWKTGVISYHNAWELKEPEDYECEEAWQPLIDLHDNHLTYADVKKYFFLDNLVDFQLHILALAINDNWGNKNHYFSIRNIQKDIDDADPNEAARRKCIITPWDLDTSLGGTYNGSAYNGNDYSVWKIEEAVNNGGFYPFHICQGQKEFQTLLKERWATLRTTVFSKESINTRLEKYRDLFVNSGAWKRMTDHWATQKETPLYVEDLGKEIDYIEEWYAKRFDMMDTYFGINTGIDNATGSQSASNYIYSIEGIKLSTPPAKGLYIQGGKLKIK